MVTLGSVVVLYAANEFRQQSILLSPVSDCYTQPQEEVIPEQILEVGAATESAMATPSATVQ